MFLLDSLFLMIKQIKMYKVIILLFLKFKHLYYVNNLKYLNFFKLIFFLNLIFK